jgi:hypothetical protein
MRFKVEIQLASRVVTKVYFAVDLEQLERQVRQDFPKGKVVTIIGG